MCLQNPQVRFQAPPFSDGNWGKISKELQEIVLDGEILANPCSIQEMLFGVEVMKLDNNIPWGGVSRFWGKGPVNTIELQTFNGYLECQFLKKSSSSTLQISDGLRDPTDAEVISSGPIFSILIYKFSIQRIHLLFVPLKQGSGEVHSLLQLVSAVA